MGSHNGLQTSSIVIAESYIIISSHLTITFHYFWHRVLLRIHPILSLAHCCIQVLSGDDLGVYLTRIGFLYQLWIREALLLRHKIISKFIATAQCKRHTTNTCKRFHLHFHAYRSNFNYLFNFLKIAYFFWNFLGEFSEATIFHRIFFSWILNRNIAPMCPKMIHMEISWLVSELLRWRLVA